MIRKRLLFVSPVLIAGCASMTTPKTPDFYPNEKFRYNGPVAAEQASRQCMAMADDYIKEPNKYRELAKDALIGGALGAGTGAVGGVIMKDSVGRATGAGAAIGGILGVVKGLSEMNERDPSYERFVEHCLQRQGYEVIGWSSK